MNRPELPPPIIGELVGMNHAGRVTGNFLPLYTRIAQLHRDDGIPYGVIGKAIGVQAMVIKAMVRAGHTRSTE